MQIFVVGKLGEIVKKLIELELVLQDDPANSFVIAEVAAYQQILNMWPVLQKNELMQAVDIFKFNLKHLKEKEECLRNEQTVILYDILAKSNYFKALDAVRHNLAYINTLGEHIGTSSILEVQDAEFETLSRQQTVLS